MHLGDEAVAPLGKCFYEPRMLGGVVQGFAQAPKNGIQIVIKIDENIVVPQPVPEFLACNEFPWMLKECRQQSYRFLPERNPEAPLEELTGSEINLIAIEADNAGHGPIPVLPFSRSVPAGEGPGNG